MTDLTTPLRGFSCAVAHVQNTIPVGQAAGVAIGLDATGDDVRVAVALRHADGTTLTGYLSESLLDRLVHMLATLVETAPAPAGVTVQ